MDLDQEIEYLNRKIGELVIKMERFRGTDRYNQLGEQIDNLSMSLAMLEGRRDHNYWMEQEEM